MSFLNTTQTLSHVSALPPPITREAAIAMLHNHEHFISCSPNNPKREPAPAPSPPPELPAGVVGLRPTDFFRVTEVVHALPAGLWDSDVISTYEFTDIEDGLFVRIRSPLNVLLETFWRVRDGAAGLEVVEDVTMKCSRLLIGVVKGACDGNWPKIHENMIAGIKTAA
ncbi:hypothetical protein B0T11DRAFT_62820 [Plectosphaerella cucumerina]|uniref:DUF7053 domain-containing protein n=1 Tax=Plectosphaerella cucumerina TaxID=40658 RepID=A0A8K0TPF7_9PEZI|nr:hypothetical protein B0T11DRAFT_62820 [Plectosphaerella cucumerina]